MSPIQNDPLMRLSKGQIQELERGLHAHGRPYLFSWLLDQPSSAAETASVPAEPPHRQETVFPRRARLSGSRSAARALVSVMLSDGTIRDCERAFVDNFLHDSRQPPLQPEEVRAWQPGELPSPKDPRAAVEALAGLVHLDAQPDRSEWQLVREFARAWRVVDTELAEIEGRFRSPGDPVNTVGRFFAALRRIAQGRR